MELQHVRNLTNGCCSKSKEIAALFTVATTSGEGRITSQRFSGLCLQLMKNESGSHAGQADSTTLSSQRSPPQRILVVDDEDSVRRLITDSLTGAGYRVDVAEDGALAWEALQVRRYDLLITDNAMPKITGIALIKKLRERNPTLPVVMATGTVPDEELERHPSLQISEVLIKPFTIEQIVRTVKKVLSGALSAGTTCR